MTARFLARDSVPHYLVVEPHEEQDYRRYHDAGSTLLVLPKDVAGHGAIPVRNWIWQHAIDAGAERHWQLDDNIGSFQRLQRGKRIKVRSDAAIRIVEDFTDRYENIAISGMNYVMFGTKTTSKPFYLNVHVYSSMLIRTDLDVRWRGDYNADADLCLQVLARGWCTVLTNVILAEKLRTMKARGGNTDLYGGDGRLRMARHLERLWPHVVETRRRFGRPQHSVRGAWAGFDTPLKRKPDLELPEGPDEYGLRLTPVADKVRSKELQKMIDEQGPVSEG